MEKQKLFVSLLIFVILLTACQSNSSVGSAPEGSQTKNGVTVAIKSVDFSEKDTVVTFVIQADPEWGLDITADPPQQALHNNPIFFDDAGKQYTAISGMYGLPQVDEATGGVRFENVVTFPPVKSNRIIFQTEIEISEISISQPVHVSIVNRQVPDIWSIGPGITFSGFADVPGTVKLLSQSGKAMELEFTFDRVIQNGLRLGCMNFYPANQDLANTGTTVTHFRECMLDENQVVSKTGMELPIDTSAPIPFHVTASAVFEKPFIVSWSKVEK